MQRAYYAKPSFSFGGKRAHKTAKTKENGVQTLVWVTSSVWNFCARYSDVVLRGLKWRPRKTSAVFENALVLRGPNEAARQGVETNSQNIFPS